MNKKIDVVARDAEWGKRMIEIKVRFWTDKIVEGKGKVRPKHAWAHGVVRVESNNVHGVIPKKPLPFNSLMELPSIIEKVLLQHGITLHLGKKMRKYIASE